MTIIATISIINNLNPFKKPYRNEELDTESRENHRTIKELVGQIHQLQKNVRDKELQMRKNEISYTYKVKAKNPQISYNLKTNWQKTEHLNLNQLFGQKPFNTHDFHQIENGTQKIDRLEKQIDHEKRINDRLTTEAKDLRIELDRIKNASQSLNQNQLKQVNSTTPLLNSI